MSPKIDKPAPAIFTAPNGSRASLVFNALFQPRRQANYSRAQKILDSEILRGTDPYIPLRTGVLIKSGILGTKIGSGLVQWIAPYAKAQYFKARPVGSETGPLRGPFWFERWKRGHGETLIKRVKREAAKS